MRRWAGNLGIFSLALVLAITVWIVATQEQNPIEQRELDEPIPIQVRNQPEGTTFLPATFDEEVMLTIRAPRNTWRDLRVDKCTAWIDLQEHGPGDYEVPVQYACTDRNARVLDHRPATVSVRLQEEISRTVPVELQLYGSAALGYKINESDKIIEPDTVTVIGPEQIVSQVDKATLDLYLRDVKETFTGIRSVVARQADGESVGSFVTIEPSLVQITVMLVGDPAVVSHVSGFVETMPLDITGATGDVVERVAVNLPEGASTVGVQGALVTVTVAAQQGSLTVVRQPVVRGLSTDLTARVSPTEVQMTLVGPLPRLESLEDEDVYVYVELVDKDVGQHKVDLTYLVPEGLQVASILPATVDVEISRVLPTRTTTATRRPIPRLTSTSVVTATVTVTATLGVTTTATPTSTPASAGQ